ncbi:hypothetical protein [Thioclava pacifica]|uniref:Nitrate reductase n=1 Tax=Thioclava pacifica DSM 10166 TaxID=1353537 RepID=A0A074J2Z8_9RHOB|nr:hypothetical protein [Thioclava pacifica]KEO50889.1 hypothetical protein TP2_13455 [Thioclava pacifica DSM 10166]
MSLLDFARGPALQWAGIIFVLGMVWRTLGIFMLMRSSPLSANRDNHLFEHGVRTVWSRFVPAPVFEKKVSFQYVAGWIWHLGFLVVLLFYKVHVMFFEGLLGFGWPALPNSIVLAIAGVTLGVLLWLLGRRIFNPVLRYISTFNDYSSVIITTLPILTGLLTFTHFGIAYETLLAIHMLSIALLLVWFPFSKLFHVITLLPSRYVLGVKFWRRGVQA